MYVASVCRIVVFRFVHLVSGDSPFTIFWKLRFCISPCSETPPAKCDLAIFQKRIQDFWIGGPNSERGVRFLSFASSFLKFPMKMKPPEPPLDPPLSFCIPKVVKSATKTLKISSISSGGKNHCMHLFQLNMVNLAQQSLISPLCDHKNL